jgi:hypothetical protein
LWQFVVLGIVSLLFGVIYARQKRKITIKTNAFDTKVEIGFGDVFEEDGLIVISVNEFFDSQVDEKHVSSRSLHGRLINDYFGGHPESFEKCADEALGAERYKAVSRSSGRGRKYGIGTTALVRTAKKEFLCVALARTDIHTLKASASVSQLWEALVGVLKKGRTEASGQGLVIPLLGGGLAGVGLLPVQIIQVMIMGIYEESKKQKICDTIKIVLPENRFEDIDLRTVERNWR